MNRAANIRLKVNIDDVDGKRIYSFRGETLSVLPTNTAERNTVIISKDDDMLLLHQFPNGAATPKELTHIAKTILSQADLGLKDTEYLWHTDGAHVAVTVAAATHQATVAYAYPDGNHAPDTITAHLDLWTAIANDILLWQGGIAWSGLYTYEWPADTMQPATTITPLADIFAADR